MARDATGLLLDHLDTGLDPGPGFSARITTPAGTFDLARGHACVEHVVPLGPSSVVPLSSMTKQFTAELVRRALAGAGLADDTRAVEILGRTVPDEYAGVTIRHLLDQRSGIPDPYAWHQQHDASLTGITTNRLLADLTRYGPPQFEPGSAFFYSNANYLLLAKVVETVTGRRYADVLATEITVPLGMSSTLVYEDGLVIPRRAWGYRSEVSDGVLRSVPIEWLSYGDGGIHSTVDDLSAWLAWIRTEGATRAAGDDASTPLGEDATTPLRDGDAPRDAGPGIVYRGGWFATAAAPAGAHGTGGTTRPPGRPGPIRRIYHYGGDPGFGSYIGYDAGLDASIVILANYDDAWKRIRAIERTLWERLGDQPSA